MNHLENRTIAGAAAEAEDAAKAFKESDLYETPPEVFHYALHKYGPFDIDVCAQLSTKKVPQYFGPDHERPESRDAFAASWSTLAYTAWMNPPYSNPAPWIDKAREECRKGMRVTALLPADTSTQWLQKNILLNQNCYIDWLPKRIRHLYNGVRSGSPKFGSIIVVFFPEVKFP